MENNSESKDFCRDKISNALINNNRNALEVYKISRNKKIQDKQDIEYMKNELKECAKRISNLEKQVAILTKDGEK